MRRGEESGAIGEAGDPLLGVVAIFQDTWAELEGCRLAARLSDCLCQRHGGRLGVESERGEGATFYFTIRRHID
jgi:light-regulated signal transduction histidine kinase (bacteriophytochrome)